MDSFGPSAPPPWRKLAIDILPLVVFFVVNWRWGLIPATIALMPAAVVSLAASYWLTRRLAPLPVVTLVVVLVLGGLTIALHDEVFIKLKPTLVSGLFAAVLLVGLVLRRPLLKEVLGDMMPLTDAGWRILTMRWAGFFVFLAIANEIIWRSVSTDSWVTFKAFGVTVLTMIFSLAQLPLLQRYKANADSRRS
ncbi:MAG: septation protein A [Alphaproteobacteria bacterium]|nr:septation protein A [Alphaproteobacteria bacterium]